MRNVVPMAGVFYEKMRKQIFDCLEQRKASAYVRAFHGHTEEGVAVCLGPGRCMMPSQTGEKTCPFCKFFPAHRGSDAEVETFIACQRSGH